MKRFIHADEEQAALLEISAQSLAAALHVRASRVDEDDHIKNSAKMGEIKMMAVLHQLSLPVPYKFRELPFEAKKAALVLMKRIVETPEAPDADMMWEALTAYVVLRPDPNEPPFDFDGEIEAAV